MSAVRSVQCVQVRDLTGTGEITKRRIKEGVGEFPIDCPLEDCAVRVHYTARLAGTDQVISPPAPCHASWNLTEVVVVFSSVGAHSLAPDRMINTAVFQILYCCQRQCNTLRTCHVHQVGALGCAHGNT